MAKRSGKSAPPKITGEERFVVLHGKELFLQTEYLRELRAALEKKAGCEVDTIRFDGQKATLADVLDELRSFGLMAQYKMVVVDRAEQFVKDHREALERYAADPVDMATFVLRDEKWNAGKLDKLIAKVGWVAKCEPPSMAEAQRWVTTNCKERHGVGITARAAVLLIDHLGADLGRIDSELGKLAAGVPDGASIDVDQIEALVGRASEEAAWEIQEALLSGNAGAAIAKLHELMDLAGQPKELLTYFTADLAKKLYRAAVMAAEGMRPFDIGKELRIWPMERQRPFMAVAQKLGPAGAAALLDRIVNLDRRAKSGGGDAVINLERFCIQFADAIH